MVTLRPIIIVSALLAACGFEPPASLPGGQWSAPEANLYVSHAGSSLELLCRSAPIPADVPLDAQGRFTLEATVAEHGAVVNYYRATIAGQLEHGDLLLTVTPHAPGPPPETHHLQKRAAPALPTCG